MNGAPVNVPATLDHVLNVLPRMPNQLQLHPVKLKRQIQYKSHYMYDMVCRDKIIGVLLWLKQHNTHYACIHVNVDWLSPTDICAYHESTENSESDSNQGCASSHDSEPNTKEAHTIMCTVSKHTRSSLCQDMCSSHDNDHYNPHMLP